MGSPFQALAKHLILLFILYSTSLSILSLYHNSPPCHKTILPSCNGLQIITDVMVNDEIVNNKARYVSAQHNNAIYLVKLRFKFHSQRWTNVILSYSALTFLWLMSYFPLVSRVFFCLNESAYVYNFAYVTFSKTVSACAVFLFAAEDVNTLFWGCIHINYSVIMG